jgi:hypothetical protein
MPDPRPRSTPAQLLYGRDGPVRELGDRKQASGPEGRRSDWVDQLRIPPQWRSGGLWDQRR